MPKILSFLGEAFVVVPQIVWMHYV